MLKEEKSLFELSSFRWWVGIIVVFALIFAITIAWNTELTYDPSADGFNKAIELFKVPLGTLALLFPVIAIIASNHRANQFAKGLVRASEQNTFANYYTHREHFFKLIEHLEEKLDISFENSSSLYSRLYPTNNSSVLLTHSHGADDPSNASLLFYWSHELKRIVSIIQSEHVNSNKATSAIISLVELSNWIGFTPNLESEKDDFVQVTAPIGYDIYAGDNYYISYTKDDPLRYWKITREVIDQLASFANTERPSIDLYKVTPKISEIVYKCACYFQAANTHKIEKSDDAKTKETKEKGIKQEILNLTGSAIYDDRDIKSKYPDN